MTVDAVELEEHGSGEPAEALVAVDERMVVDDRLQQRGGLGPDVGIGVLAERRRLRARHGRAQESDVADRRRVAEQASARSMRSSRSRYSIGSLTRRAGRRASACASLIERARPRHPVAVLPRATNSRTARRAASCIEMPSASARSRSAACSSSVSRSVIAMLGWYQSDTVQICPGAPVRARGLQTSTSDLRSRDAAATSEMLDRSGESERLGCWPFAVGRDESVGGGSIAVAMTSASGKSKSAVRSTEPVPRSWRCRRRVARSRSGRGRRGCESCESRHHHGARGPPGTRRTPRLPWRGTRRLGGRWRVPFGHCGDVRRRRRETR